MTSEELKNEVLVQIESVLTKCHEMREEGEGDLRTVIHLLENLAKQVEQL